MRMHIRRFTLLINGFSKKIENQLHALSLHFICYNFAKTRKSLRDAQQWKQLLTIMFWVLKK